MDNRYTARIWLFASISFWYFIASCTTPGPAGLFGKKSLHDDYGERIKNAGLAETALGRRWFSTAEQTLQSPLLVSLPYSEAGYFPADEPKATGLLFIAKRGEKLTIKLEKKPVSGFAVYADLWQRPASAETKPGFLLSFDTSLSNLQYDVEKDGEYILRLQPELLKGGEYVVSISTGPSLAFPVSANRKVSIGSFWGVGRDNGNRRHEGIDIFAPRGTPLLAAADGVVTRVEENRLGGKVIFLAPDNKDYSLYYAHLEKQIAQPGQRVRIGDTLGLVGNTGNAITTVPHLHFGIYTTNGAIDPLPFVKPATSTPAKIMVSNALVNRWARSSMKVQLRAGGKDDGNASILIKPNTIFKIEAATADSYKVSLPSGEKGFLPARPVVEASTAIRKVSLEKQQPLLDAPDIEAPKKTHLPAGQTISVCGNWKDFYFVMIDKLGGWVPAKQ
jgi:murein DD-endopeptidase MepM/ murein hydrolase activator NlpD